MAEKQRKSVFWAYVCWLFGGIFGLHLFYLERDAHAFLTWSTLGGYGLGWLADVTKIPRYVRECNEDAKFLEEFVAKLRKFKKVRIYFILFCFYILHHYYYTYLYRN